MKKYYVARAPEYEQIYYRDDKERQAELAAEADRLVRLSAGKDVLELACGSGYWTQLISTTANSIVALDYSEAMLKEAKKKEFGCDIQFLRGDLYNPPVKENSFDLVALGFWFSHHPKHQFNRLFDALCRPLRQDLDIDRNESDSASEHKISGERGRIWMIDNNPPAEGPTNYSVHKDEYGNNYKARKLDNGKRYRVLKNYFSESDLTEILSPRFVIKRLTHGKHYWSVVLGVKGKVL